MNKSLIGATALAVGLAAGSASASVFSGYTETSDVYFDDTAAFSYHSSFGGGVSGAIGTDTFGMASTPLTGTSMVILGYPPLSLNLASFALLGTYLDVDNGAADDTFSMLFSLTVGVTDYAIATFTGNFDGADGSVDFLADGFGVTTANVPFIGTTYIPDPEYVSVNVVGATVVPLPAALPLLAGALGLLTMVSRRRRES